jgi:hypothetical protein
MGYLVIIGIIFIKLFRYECRIKRSKYYNETFKTWFISSIKIIFFKKFFNEFKDWDYKRDLFDLDKNGFGTAVYSFKKKDRVYSLVCFANKIKDDERSDRVIATKWDAAFTLHDGVPLKKDIERLKNEVPKQEVGRLSYKELTLSRANKSVRVFDHVVESLSNGFNQI